MGILRTQGKNTNYGTRGSQMAKYCTKMETTIKLNFSMINLIFNMIVNINRKSKKKIRLYLALLTFVNLFGLGKLLLFFFWQNSTLYYGQCTFNS